MEEFKQDINSLKQDVRALRDQYHSLDKQGSLTAQAVDLLTANVQLMTTAVGELKGVGDRWRGIIIAGLFFGPIIGALTGMLVRVLLFGEPLSHGPGLINK